VEFPWGQVIVSIASNILGIYDEPMFWIILALVGYQYYEQQNLQKQLFGKNVHSLPQQILLAALFGTLGGFCASFLLAVVGVTLNELGIKYIWPLALLLMAVQTRFICFAYAGGLVALSHVLFGWPQVNVPQLLALIAILHITESLLIALSGKYGAAPIIVRRPDGQLAGAFTLQNFWPLPLVVLVAFLGELGGMRISVFTQVDWWPLISQNLSPAEGRNWLFGAMPVVAALGYSDLAISSTPRQRRQRSALHLALYSGSLLVLAILSAHYSWLQAIAAILAPAGHEYLIQRDQAAELRGKPLFTAPEQGVMVLETVMDSPARKLGLETGDVLRQLDGMEIHNTYDLAQALGQAGELAVLVWERAGVLQEGAVRWRQGQRRLGVIPVPETHATRYVEITPARLPLADWFHRLFKAK